MLCPLGLVFLVSVHVSVPCFISILMVLSLCLEACVGIGLVWGSGEGGCARVASEKGGVGGDVAWSGF